MPNSLTDPARFVSKMKKIKDRKEKVAVFGSPRDPNKLTLIYVPAIKHPDDNIDPMSFSTFEFQFDADKTEKLYEYARKAALEQAELIKSIIVEKTTAMNDDQE
jgi:hypothetical protein